ncbi:processing protease [Crocosphaera subtropica ATCC 51142]|uniref:Processing protease n=1 Tax=Crocosphaera subtropica (strain ATCC 51142 / BH68) TaxID=43989 RepID=B1WQQ7_CROS5|nr:pitrilysin family protein [Crocosphaera subtropica]ACB53359.1 processing protease [Crocosphaera subtropica ATCC 51142]
MLSSVLDSSATHAPTIVNLDNGLTIIAEQMPVEAVNLNVWLRVGSALESNDINGMAHFLEHMVFKGTPKLKSGEFEQRIEQKGAVTNAATSQEYTHFYVTSAPPDFAELVPLQLDVVFNPMIENGAFEREKLVVLEEIRRSHDNPNRRTFYRAMETCFESLPYRRPVLGPASVIEGLTSQQMREFHGSCYHPTSVTAVAVGNLPVEELVETVANSFEQTYYAKQTISDTFKALKFPTVPELPFQDIIRQEYEDDQLQQARLIMMWKVPGFLELNETYALDVLASILGKGKTSRLFQDLREDKGLVSQISVSNMTQKVQGMFYVAAKLSKDNITEVEKIIIQHLHKIQKESIKEEELNRIKRQAINRFIFNNERPSDRTNLYGYYYSQMQDINMALSYPQIIQSLTLNDIQKAAQKYLNLNAYGVTIVKNCN